MNSDALVIAVEAINKDASGLTSTHTAVAQANQAISAAHYEMALAKVADAPPVQGPAATGDKAVAQVGLDPIPTDRPLYEFTLHPMGDNQTLQRRVTDYLEGFSGRASSYASEIKSMFPAAPSSGGGAVAGAVNASGAPISPDGAMSAETAMKLMKRTFEFAVEVEFVSSASQKSTKVVNELMKGQ